MDDLPSVRERRFRPVDDICPHDEVEEKPQSHERELRRLAHVAVLDEKTPPPRSQYPGAHSYKLPQYRLQASSALVDSQRRIEGALLTPRILAGHRRQHSVIFLRALQPRWTTPLRGAEVAGKRLE